MTNDLPQEGAYIEVDEVNEKQELDEQVIIDESNVSTSYNRDQSESSIIKS